MTKQERAQRFEELLANLKPEDAAKIRAYLGSWDSPDFDRKARRLADLIEYAMAG